MFEANQSDPFHCFHGCVHLRCRGDAGGPGATWSLPGILQCEVEEVKKKAIWGLGLYFLLTSSRILDLPSQRWFIAVIVGGKPS